MTDQGSMVKLTASDGHVLQAFSAPAAGAAKGGLVIIQEVFGVTDQLKALAGRFAAAGFATLVPALFDRIAPGLVVPFDELDEARAMPNRVEEAAVLRDLTAARDYFGPEVPVSVMGFCWGGGLAVAAAEACGEADASASVRRGVSGQRGLAAGHPAAGLGQNVTQCQCYSYVWNPDQDRPGRQGWCVAGCPGSDEGCQVDLGQRFAKGRNDGHHLRA